MAHYRKPTGVTLSKKFYDFDKECWKQQHLKVKEIQKVTTGKGAVLGFLDDGVGINEEIIGKVISPLYSYLDTDSWAGEHSTLGATLVMGNTLGIFPEMKVVSKQVLDPSNGVGSTQAVVSAIYKAKALGIGCINLSLGSDDADPSMKKALQDYCSNGKNIATIAAGNDSRETDYPAQYAKYIDGVLSVAATSIEGDGGVKIAMFSSFGEITIAAPGHALTSRDHTNKLDLVSGTSFAAPIVGSAIAVAQMLRPGVTQREILSVLKNTAIKLHELTTKQGYGEIDILSFLTRMKDPEPISIPKDFRVTRKKSIWSWLK